MKNNIKKTNKKGFTLVELLAVIVILGILLLIAVPSISNVIKTSKRKTFETTAKLIVENVQSLLSLEALDGTVGNCYIPISEIKLDRGSVAGINGYVKVYDDKITITASNGSYKISEQTLNTIKSVPSTDSVSDSPTVVTTKCSWYYN